MIAVIFEVVTADGETAHDLDLAAALRPELETIDGFISVERFQSLTEPTKLLPLSFWRDEEAIRTGATGPATGRPRPRAAARCSPMIASGSRA